MSVDERGRQARDALHASTRGLDADDMRVRLQRMRSRRNRARVVGAAAAVALLAGVGWAVDADRFDGSTQPADSPPTTQYDNGGIFDGRPGSVAHRAAATDASFSPDGSQMAAVAEDRVWIQDTFGVERTVLGVCDGFCTIDWSPRGDLLAVSDNGVLELWPVDGGSPSRVDTGDLRVDWASWSPDAEAIAFAGATAGARMSPGSSGLYVVGVDGGSPRLVWRSPESDDPSPPNTWYPEWSPVSDEIAFIRSDPRQPKVPSTKDLALMIVSTDDGAVRGATRLEPCVCLGLTPDLAWSPDGRKIATHEGIVTLEDEPQAPVGPPLKAPIAWRPVPR